MSNQKEYNLIEYFITIFLGAILTAPGGTSLSPLIFFFVDKTKKGIIYKSKRAIWIVFGILPFVLNTYPSFILSRRNIYTNEIIRDLNDQEQSAEFRSLIRQQRNPKLAPEMLST